VTNDDGKVAAEGQCNVGICLEEAGNSFHSGVASIGPGRAKARPLIDQVGPLQVQLLEQCFTSKL